MYSVRQLSWSKNDTWMIKNQSLLKGRKNAHTD